MLVQQKLYLFCRTGQQVSTRRASVLCVLNSLAATDLYIIDICVNSAFNYDFIGVRPCSKYTKYCFLGLLLRLLTGEGHIGCYPSSSTTMVGMNSRFRYCIPISSKKGNDRLLLH